MAKFVERGQAVGCTTPVLVIHTIMADGDLKDANTVEFQVFDEGGNQTFPGAGRQAVNLADCPTGDKLSTGTYAAAWAIPTTEPTGKHTIQWFWKETATSAEITYTQEFEVLDANTIKDPLAPTYASIHSLRCEGLDETEADDERLLKLIGIASRLVERYTKRFFEPRYLDMVLDGSGGRKMLLDQVIIAVESVAIDVAPITGGEFPIDRDNYQVYNRHMSGLLSPDDRNNPKVEFFHDRDLFGIGVPEGIVGVTFSRLTFPRGPQTVRVSGVFGYTDPDGTPFGRTPSLIERVTELLVIRELPKAGDPDGREDARKRWRLISETTRDQSYRLSSAGGRGGISTPAMSGMLTGDPDIDNILVMYMRPPAMGAA